MLFKTFKDLKIKKSPLIHASFLQRPVKDDKQLNKVLYLI